MINYNIINTIDGKYSALVIVLNSDSPLEYIKDIENSLITNRIYGKILIDQILHVGNSEDRFLELTLDSDGIDQNSLRVVRINKGSQYRKLSGDNLRGTDILEFSILSSIQKRMINKGISI